MPSESSGNKKPLSQELKAKGMTIEEIRQKEGARKLQHFDHGWFVRFAKKWLGHNDFPHGRS